MFRYDGGNAPRYSEGALDDRPATIETDVPRRAIGVQRRTSPYTTSNGVERIRTESNTIHG